MHITGDTLRCGQLFLAGRARESSGELVECGLVPGSFAHWRPEDDDIAPQIRQHEENIDVPTPLDDNQDQVEGISESYGKFQSFQ